jgi:hypothetical protein
MRPVNVNGLDIGGDHAAGGVIAFGAAVYRTGAGIVSGCLCTAASTAFMGIAVDDIVEDDTSIEAGDYLELAVLGSSNTLPVGVFMEAVAGTPAGTVRTTATLARAMEDKTLTSALKWVKTEAGKSVAIGATTITLTTTKTALFTVGDYILLEDLNGEVQINRVKSKSGAVLTLEIASTVALIGDTDYLHILTQVEAILI